MHPTNIVLLEFHQEHDNLAPNKELRDGLSVVLQMGRNLWLANDETVSLERLTLMDKDSTGRSSSTHGHKQFALHDFLPLPLPPHGATPDEINEADIEGLAFDGNYLWLTGSHSLKRKQPRPDDGVKKAHKRLCSVSADGNRYLLARIPVIEQDGEYTLVKEEGKKAKMRTAAMLRTDEHGNDLTALLRADEHFGPFLSIPGKDNGFDIEGIAVVGKHLLLGLRGPVLRGWAAIIEVALVDDTEPGWMRLAPVSDDGKMMRKHFLNLDGLGVRDLCVQGEDILILAGPTMDLDGPVYIYRWVGGATPTKDTVVPSDCLERVLVLPYGQGVDHPEGISLFCDKAGAGDELLVVYDAASPARQIGDSTVLADVFSLPVRKKRGGV
ncbi:hypothetical protein CR105_00175 [Massilia eurypsychrophila]|jgi:hypothetical protein|uniref:DUF3616 domain-containing protein n=1 Tax=Massilia eurypsychrophila TaxID=1485217 RepID=A0A2G8TKN8_9BURK|nr:DUF3616 domain-containing protein [Massilia eurypsychrophila]PIL46615.1 hypothetical protein CR105_00175 [Massilia eurypsychrophila]